MPRESSTGPPGGVGRRLLASSAWVLAGRLLFGVSVLLQNVVLARLLPPEQVGLFLTIQALVLPAAIIAVWGLDLVAIRSVRHDGPGGPVGLGGPGGPGSSSTAVRYAPAAYLRSATIVVGLAALAIVAAGGAGLSLWCGNMAATSVCLPWREHGWLLWPLVFLAALQLLLVGIFRGLDEIVRSTLLVGVLPTALFLAAITGSWLLGGHPDVGLLLRVQIAALLLTLIVAATRLRRRRHDAADRCAEAGRSTAADLPAEAPGWRTLARLGPGLMVTQLLALLVSQSDVWVLGLVDDPDAVARYGVAARLAQLVSLPHLVLNGALSTLIVGYLAAGRAAALQRIVQAAVALATLPALALAGLFAVAGTTVLSLAFGPFYAAAAPTLAILALGQVVNVACGPCFLLMALAGHQRLLNGITAVSAVACIGLGHLAATHFGAVGLALVYATGLAVHGVVIATVARRMTGVRTQAGYRALGTELVRWRTRRMASRTTAPATAPGN